MASSKMVQELPPLSLVEAEPDESPKKIAEHAAGSSYGCPVCDAEKVKV